MINEEIIARLFDMRDESYRDFQSKLIPTVDKAAIIGVRTPDLRRYAKELFARADKDAFLNALPHTYYDENQLHAFIISLEKDFSVCLRQVEAFLPYIDNWAVCDQKSPAVFQKHKRELLPSIERWLKSDHVYTVRFAVKMLMALFLDEDFDVRYPTLVAAIRSDEYYINMMRAWYFATALAKQYDQTLPFLTGRRLDAWTHNKAIQKAVESYRISDETKAYLRTLKLPSERKSSP